VALLLFSGAGRLGRWEISDVNVVGCLSEEAALDDNHV
jgi:hypothetical protein